MPAPLQGAAAARFAGAGVLIAGGLPAADPSSDAVRVVRRDGGRLLGRLPYALHDSAAVELDGATYLFGGGNGTRQLDQILRIDTAGRGTVAGRLPAPRPHPVAATVHRTGYLIRR